MTDSIKLPVEIEYHFRWENPCFKQKIEVFACDAHVATVDKLGTLFLKPLPCLREVSHAARVWAGWEKATPDNRPPTTDSRPPTTDDPWKYPEGYSRPPTTKNQPPTSDLQPKPETRKLVLLSEDQSRTIKELLWVAEGESAVDAEKVRELSVAINMLTDYQPPMTPTLGSTRRGIGNTRRGTAESRPPTNDIRPLTVDENRLPLTRLDILRLVVERYQQCVSKLLTLFPFDPLGESPAHFYIERLEALIDRKLLIPNLPLNPTSAPITREQTSAIRQLIRASYFNVPGLHSHVLLEVFDHLILEANCEFDECTCERDATAHSQDCPIVRKYCLMVPGGTIFPPADWPGWARTPDARPPTTDRRLPTTETPLDSSDLRTAMHHCPECRAVGEPDDHRHKPWCSKVVGSP